MRWDGASKTPLSSRPVRLSREGSQATCASAQHSQGNINLPMTASPGKTSTRSLRAVPEKLGRAVHCHSCRAERPWRGPGRKVGRWSSKSTRVRPREGAWRTGAAFQGQAPSRTPPGRRGHQAWATQQDLPPRQTFGEPSAAVAGAALLRKMI